MNELNKLYKAMLLSFGCVIKEDGKITYSMDGEEFPIRIDDMDLHLPLSEILDGNVINKVFFHPACENITSKETEVFKLLRKMTTMWLLESFRNLPIVLFKVAGKEKKSWKQNILDMLAPIKSSKRATRKELTDFFAMMEVEIGESGLDNRFIHLRVTKGGNRDRSTGEKVYYRTKPTFPLYNEVVKRVARTEGQSDNQLININGESFTKGCLKLVIHLFQYLLPAVNNPDDFEFASTSPVAARLVSYLGCYADLAEQLNRVQNSFRSEFNAEGIYPINTDWREDLELLPEIYRQVPVMDYNSHNTQEEVDVAIGTRNGMGNLLNVQTNLQQTPNDQNVQSNQQQVKQTVGDYDLTPPIMEAGDKFLRTEIDHLNTRVLHHAQTPHGNPVVYQCTRHGNLLQRVEQTMTPQMAMYNQMMGMGMGNQMGMMGFNNPATMSMGNQMGMQPNNFNQPTATATTAVSDGGSSIGGAIF